MDDRLTVEEVRSDPVQQRRREFVERKGIGHPDSLCDGIAEAVSRRLSRHYRREFDRVHHHNTDKVHLGAGRAEPSFGGGTVHEPIYVLVGGRATQSVDGESVPVEDLAREAAREYLLETVPELDASNVEVDTRIGATSETLASLFERGDGSVANDTSYGAGHAPLSPTEGLVRTLEPRVHEGVDAVGKDVKLMAMRRDDRIEVTIAAAVIDRYVAGIEEYREVVARIREVASDHAERVVDLPVEVAVNAADPGPSGSGSASRTADLGAADVYLTATGLSAEAGDDGAVGRGNRATGLITPGRPTSLEAAAGKNPVAHAGKLYNLLAIRIARRLSYEHGADHAGVQLLSRIGEPISEPTAVDVETTADEESVEQVVRGELGAVDTLTEDLIDGHVDVF